MKQRDYGVKAHAQMKRCSIADVALKFEFTGPALPGTGDRFLRFGQPADGIAPLSEQADMVFCAAFDINYGVYAQAGLLLEKLFNRVDCRTVIFSRTGGHSLSHNRQKYSRLAHDRMSEACSIYSAAKMQKFKPGTTGSDMFIVPVLYWFKKPGAFSIARMRQHGFDRDFR